LLNDNWIALIIDLPIFALDPLNGKKRPTLITSKTCFDLSILALLDVFKVLFIDIFVSGDTV